MDCGQLKTSTDDCGYGRRMQVCFRRFRPALVLALPALLAVACSTPLAGSAQPADGATRLAPSSTAVSAIVSSSAGSTVSSSAELPVDRTTDIGSGDWTSAECHGRSGRVPAPTGRLTAQLTGNRVCLRPVPDPGAGPESCAQLSEADRPTFAVYSPDGLRLLLVAGPDGSADRSIYVIEADDGAIRVIGPDGVTDHSAGNPPRWNLETVAWSPDGSVVIIPHTDADTGPVLLANLADGSVTESTRLPDVLANGKPSIWPTRNGTALVLNDGPDRRYLWWDFEPSTPSMTAIGSFQVEGGSLYLATADPLGRFVLACPRSPDGRLGATVGVNVLSRESFPGRTDSTSCAGAVFSADGRYLALTAQLAGGYSLVVVEVSTNRRVVTAALPVTEPTQPPYLTWLGDVVVAVDVSGGWAAPSLIMRLR